MSDLFLTNGTIYTLDPARPRANAMAFVNGRVAAHIQKTKPGEWILGMAWNCAVPPQHLLETGVEQTIVGGKVVYGGQ